MRVILVLLFIAVILSTPCYAIKYFPNDTLAGRADLHELLDNAYSKQLKALAEPSLLELSSNREIYSYRFLYLRSFHEPISIRIEISPDGAGTLFVKMCDGAGGSVPGNLIKDTTIHLPMKAVSALLGKLVDANFWNMASFDHSNLGLDGASWIVEGTKEGRYHVVDRQSPTEGTYRDLGIFFLKLSGIVVEKIY